MPSVRSRSRSGVLLLGVLAWRSQSALVGAVYLVVGAFFTFMLVILWKFAAEINGAPPLLPGPAADAVGQIYQWSYGPLNAVATIGAGMFLVGLLVVGRALRARIVGRRATEPVSGISPTGTSNQGVTSALSDTHLSTGNRLRRG